MQAARAKSQRSMQQAGGFSLVEMMIAAVLMVIATIGTVGMFNYGISQNSSSRGKQEEQSAISEDVADIQRINDRYTCSNEQSCAVATNDPGENSYYPTGPSPSSPFNTACLKGTLLDNLIDTITTTPTPTAFSRLGISRSVSVSIPSDGRYNRYTVTWSNRAGTRLRQITLVPTVAGWCP
jgi:type II secretory pathway pseudopilin PulG